MLSMLKRFVLPVLLIVSPSAFSELPEGLDKILSKFKNTAKGMSFYVSRVDKASPWLMHQSRVARNPASVAKLLTTAVGLDILGPAYTWQTEFYVNKLPEDGHLRGPLYIKGHGDPYITVERYWAMIQELRNAGIEHIHGKLILDANYFARTRKSTASFDGQGSRSYNVQPYALLVNFQSLRLRFTPKKNSVEIQSFPKVSTIKIENRLRLTRGRCGGWKAKLKIKSVVRRKRETIVITGRYSKRCRVKYTYRAAQNASNYTAGLFISMWRQQGGTITGTRGSGRVPKNAKLVLSAPSLTLADIIRRINKYSNNVMTRHLLLTVIAESISVPARKSRGERVIKKWLRKQNIDTSNFQIDNGAGLSRFTRVSAFQLGEALKAVYRKSYMSELVSSLPISGVDGTMARRKLTKESHGQMHLKTGLLENVRSVAGYYLNSKGHRYVVVVLHNNPSAHTRRAKRLQSRILDWLYLNSP